MRRPATERTAWSATRTVRSMRSSGIANGRPSASTISAAMIASVSGRRIWALVPLPCSEVMMTSPPSPRIAARTASMPTPRPEMSLVTSAVEKPGGEQQLDGARHVDRVDRGGVDQPALGGLLGHLAGVDAATVVGDRDDHVAAGVARGDLERARGRLARRDALLRRPRGRGRASCGRGARAGRRARRPRCGRARCPCPRAAGRPACRAWSRGRARAAGSAGRRPPPGSSGPA